MTLTSLQALAVALGRIEVLSAMGEPLQAEIDMPGLTDTEAAALKPSLSAPATFRAAGLLYLQELNNLRVTLEKRGERRVLLLQGERPISSTYVDLIIEAHGTDNRVVRGYTILVPATRKMQPVPPPIASQSPTASAPAPTILTVPSVKTPVPAAPPAP
ncbi:MAG: type IV pilus assembly protein FimV, partial [Hylemonella sp.]